jgi:hypothetical protein
MEDVMAHPWYHAVMATRRYGGTPEDYLEIETWMDFTKSHTPDCRHRLLIHNSWGIFLAERILGATITRASDGKVIPLRPLLEDHITQDFGKIPTLAACFAQLPSQPIEHDVTVYEHCVVSAATWGGAWNDYTAIHQFLDWPRDYLPDGRHRRVLHNSWGIYRWSNRHLGWPSRAYLMALKWLFVQLPRLIFWAKCPTSQHLIWRWRVWRSSAGCAAEQCQRQRFHRRAMDATKEHETRLWDIAS